ncbi:MAG: hypothetical protein ACMXYD_00835 [Candidatus Woesearchaeota archaeon]
MREDIETGVDRLIQLIEKEEKISVSQAAKSLGVSKLVVSEWAEFLEEEQLITLEYSLSQTYLKLREVSDKELAKHAKDFSNKKDMFIRKVDSALMQLEQHHDNAQQVKEQFVALKKDLGGEVDAVRKQLKELEKYEKAKQAIDEDIENEFAKYEKKITQAHSLLEQERKRFSSLLGELDEQEEALGEQEKSLESLESLKDSLSQKADEIDELLVRAKKELTEQSQGITKTHKHIDSLKEQIANERSRVDSIETKNLDSLEQQRKKHEKEIKAMHEEIVLAAQEAKKRINKDVEESKKVAKKFEKFFKNRLDGDKELEELEKQRKQLAAEYELLHKSAVSFRVAGKAQTHKQLVDLQKKFDTLEKQHTSYKKKLQEIAKHMFG